VARLPEVFVQSLEPEQAQRLVKIARTSRDRVRLRRAGIVLASVQGRSAAQIAAMFAASEGYVREVIHAFNDTGFAALDPKWSGGRPRKFGPAAHELICQTARSTPSALGQPFATWSLTKLADYLAEHFRADGVDRDDPAGAAQGRYHLAGHQDLEGKPGSPLCGEDGPGPGPLRQPARGRAGDLRRSMPMW
jgi:transposase